MESDGAQLETSRKPSSAASQSEQELLVLRRVHASLIAMSSMLTSAQSDMLLLAERLDVLSLTINRARAAIREKKKRSKKTG